VNEIALLCHRIGISSKDVLHAAGTKWNFLPFKPGLVGGHCIGVDPYYLVEKAKQLHMKTHVIDAGRLINDAMSAHVAEMVTEALGQKKKGAKVLVLGLTFKENIPDTRNSKAQDVVKHLHKAGCDVSAHDPFVSPDDLQKMKITHGTLEQGPYDAIVLLVPHQEYLRAGTSVVLKALKADGILFDLKSILAQAEVEEAGMKYLAL
jgi:UDP-N-acetyl-D-galactosamine dehydrogenase